MALAAGAGCERGPVAGEAAAAPANGAGPATAAGAATEAAAAAGWAGEAT